MTKEIESTPVRQLRLTLPAYVPDAAGERRRDCAPEGREHPGGAACPAAGARLPALAARGESSENGAPILPLAFERSESAEQQEEERPPGAPPARRWSGCPAKPTTENDRFHGIDVVSRERGSTALVEPIAVGVYEVTRGQWSEFASQTGHYTGDACWTYEDGEWEERSGRSWSNPGFSQSDTHPVVCVNWDDARAYVRWLSRKTGERYRMLSESEWEYVARARTSTSRYWGDSETGQCRYANGADRILKQTYSDWTWEIAACRDGAVHTSAVGSYERNGYGLHDMLGNVWEWTADCWNESYGGAPRDGSVWERGDCSKRVLRGGSWDDAPGYLRSANRFRFSSGNRGYDFGFRIARTLTP